MGFYSAVGRSMVAGECSVRCSCLRGSQQQDAPPMSQLVQTAAALLEAHPVRKAATAVGQARGRPVCEHH